MPVTYIYTYIIYIYIIYRYRYPLCQIFSRVFPTWLTIQFPNYIDRRKSLQPSNAYYTTIFILHDLFLLVTPIGFLLVYLGFGIKNNVGSETLNKRTLGGTSNSNSNNNNNNNNSSSSSSSGNKKSSGLNMKNRFTTGTTTLLPAKRITNPLRADQSYYFKGKYNDSSLVNIEAYGNSSINDNDTGSGSSSYSLSSSKSSSLSSSSFASAPDLCYSNRSFDSLVLEYDETIGETANKDKDIVIAYNKDVKDVTRENNASSGSGNMISSNSNRNSRNSLLDSFSSFSSNLFNSFSSNRDRNDSQKTTSVFI